MRVKASEMSHLEATPRGQGIRRCYFVPDRGEGQSGPATGLSLLVIGKDETFFSERKVVQKKG